MPYARRDVEVEIARCSLRVVTLKASPTRLPQSCKKAAKIVNLAACNILASTSAGAKLF